MTTLNGLPVPWCKLSNLPELFLCNVTLGDGVVSEDAVHADVDVDDDITRHGVYILLQVCNKFSYTFGLEESFLFCTSILVLHA